MRDALPRLRESLVDGRDEVERFLGAPWEAPRAWVFLDERHHVKAVSRVAEELAEETVESLGFVDPALVAQYRTKGWPTTGWRIGAESDTAEAWKAHLAWLLHIALQEALETFPTSYAGNELKAALLRQDGYGPDDAEEAIEDILEWPGRAGLSDDANLYVRLSYDPDPSYLAHADEPDDAWWRHRVLPDEIMAILDAVQRAEASEWAACLDAVERADASERAAAAAERTLPC